MAKAWSWWNLAAEAWEEHHPTLVGGRSLRGANVSEILRPLLSDTNLFCNVMAVALHFHYIWSTFITKHILHWALCVVFHCIVLHVNTSELLVGNFPPWQICIYCVIHVFYILLSVQLHSLMIICFAINSVASRPTTFISSVHCPLLSWWSAQATFYITFGFTQLPTSTIYMYTLDVMPLV